MKRLFGALAASLVLLIALHEVASAESWATITSDQARWYKMGKSDSTFISLPFSFETGGGTSVAFGDTTGMISLPGMAYPAFSGAVVLRAWLTGTIGPTDSTRCWVIYRPVPKGPEITRGPLYATAATPVFSGTDRAVLFNLAFNTAGDSLQFVPQFRLVFENYDGSSRAGAGTGFTQVRYAVQYLVR